MRLGTLILVLLAAGCAVRPDESTRSVAAAITQSPTLAQYAAYGQLKVTVGLQAQVTGDLGAKSASRSTTVACAISPSRSHQSPAQTGPVIQNNPIKRTAR